MPLKNPKELPKLPKTRQKKAEGAIAAIPQKKEDKIEYVCRTFFKYDKLLAKQYSVIRIETIAEFTSFSYEVAVDVLHDKQDLFIVIKGLKANTNAVPKIGPALAEIYFEDFIGEYRINIVKQDGAINTGLYIFNPIGKKIILENKIKPKKKNNRWFCEFSVAEDLFSFNSR